MKQTFSLILCQLFYALSTSAQLTNTTPVTISFSSPEIIFINTNALLNTAFPEPASDTNQFTEEREKFVSIMEKAKGKFLREFIESEKTSFTREYMLNATLGLEGENVWCQRNNKGYAYSFYERDIPLRALCGLKNATLRSLTNLLGEPGDCDGPPYECFWALYNGKPGNQLLALQVEAGCVAGRNSSDEVSYLTICVANGTNNTRKALTDKK